MSQRPPERRFFIQFLLYWLPVLLYVTLIFTLSGQANLKAPLGFNGGDKVCHVLEYLGLGVLLSRAIRGSMRLRYAAFAAAITLGFGVLIGASDEFYQSFIPGRDSSVYDLLADTGGLILSQLAYVWFASR